MMESALIAVAAFIAVVFFSYRARRKLNLLHAYEECMNTFYKNAGTLLAAEDTPIEVVDMIEFMEEKASDPRAAREFLLLLHNHRREMASNSEHPMSRALNSFSNAHPELGRVLGSAMSAGLLAMTFKGGPIGTFVRRLVLFDAKRHEERTQDLAANFREIESHAPQAQAA